MFPNATGPKRAERREPEQAGFWTGIIAVLPGGTCLGFVCRGGGR